MANRDRRVTSGNGIFGAEYEIGVLTLYTLKAYTSRKPDFTFHHGLTKFFKLDDFIIETDESIQLGQIKQRKIGELSKDHIFNESGEFSLMVYMKNFKDIFSDSLNQVQKIIQSQNEKERLLLVKDKFESRDDSFFDDYEKLIETSRYLEEKTKFELLKKFQNLSIHFVTNFAPNKELMSIMKKQNDHFSFHTKNFINDFYEALDKFEPKLPKTFVKIFMKKFQYTLVDTTKIEKEILNILRMIGIDEADRESCYRHLYDEIKIWSQDQKRNYLNKLCIESFLANYHSNKFIKHLRNYNNPIKLDIPDELLPRKYDCSFTVVKTTECPKKFWEIHRNLGRNKRNKVCYPKKPNESTNLQKAIDDFVDQEKEYTHFICVLKESEEFTRLLQMFHEIKIQQHRTGKSTIIITEEIGRISFPEDVTIIQDTKEDLANNLDINNSNGDSGRNQMTIIKSNKYLLIMSILQEKWSQEIDEGKILFVDPTILKIQKCLMTAFNYPKYTHIICSLHENNLEILKPALHEVYFRMKNYKKIILILDDQLNFPFPSHSCVIEESALFKEIQLNFKREQSRYEKYITRNLSKYVKVEKNSETMFMPLTNSLEQNKSEESKSINNNQIYSERAFSEMILGSEQKVILISSPPGVGKTHLLRSLAQRINEDNNLWAIRIELNEHSELLCKYNKSGKIPQLIELCETTLESNVKKEIAMIPNLIILMVDGMDEISPDYFDLVLSFLYKTLPRVKKLIITTRNEYEQQLKKEFGVESYHIRDLSNEDISLLLSQLSNWNSDDVRKWYNETIDDNLRTFLKIPLHAKLFAELYGATKSLPSGQNINLGKLYDLVLDAENKELEKKFRFAGNVEQRRALDQKLVELKKFYKDLAMKAFFSAEQLKIFNIRSKLVHNSNRSTTIVEYVAECDAHKFRHRTFLEYFVAEKLVEIIMAKKYPTEQFLRNVIKNIIFNDSYGSLHGFIEHHLSKKTIENIDALIFYTKYYHENFETELNNIVKLVKNGYLSILKLILDKLDSHNMFSKILSLAFMTQPLAVVKHTDMVKYLVGKGAAVDIKDETSSSMAHWSVVNGNLDLIKILCEKRADMNAKNFLDFTPLHLAILRNETEIAVHLIERGTNVNAIAKNGWTCLHIAASKNDLQIIDCLIQKSVDVNATVTDYIIDDPETQRANVSGWSALHFAARRGFYEVFKKLHQKCYGIDKNKRNVLLMLAKQGSNKELIKYIEECVSGT